MNSHVYFYYLALLLCVQLRSAVGNEAFSNWIRRCFGPKGDGSPVTIADFSSVVDFFNPARSSSSAQSLMVSRPSQAELVQIRDIVIDDAKTDQFMRYGSPSLREHIINLAQHTPEVSTVIGAAVAKEAENGVVTTNVPMSKAVLEQTMKLNKEQIAEVQRRTRRYASEADAERRFRLTADLFGSVCLGATEEAMGAWMSSPRPNPDFYRELNVLKPLENEIMKTIKPCGLFVDEDRGYLAALPDGLVDDNAIVKLNVLNRPGLDTSRYKWNRGKGLPRDGHLYYEIQGLLAITKRELCYLIIVTRESMQHVYVWRDEDFWQNEMLGKLENFFFDILHPRLSNDKLPNINDIRVAAGIILVVTTEISHKHMQEITLKTQLGSFDTLLTESRTRLLAKDFYIIMDDTKLMKTKVREILQNYYENRKKWESERAAKMEIARRFADKNNLDVDVGGLIIDKTNRFLAAFPAAFGYRKDKSRKETDGPELDWEYLARTGRVTQIAQPKNGGKDDKGRKSTKVGRAVSSITKTPSQIMRTMTRSENSKSNQERQETIIIEVVTPEEVAASKSLPEGAEVTSVKKGTKNYYRIQGTLAIARAKTCVFIVAGQRERFEKVEFDPAVWAEMLDKLKHFYYSVYLIRHAAPKEFERMFRGPSLQDLMGWPAQPKPEKGSKGSQARS